MSSELPSAETGGLPPIVDYVLTFAKAGELQIVGRDSTTTFVDMPPQQAERFSSALAAMYLAVGPGVHPIEDVRAGSDLYINSFRPNIKLIPGLLRLTSPKGWLPRCQRRANNCWTAHYG